MGTTHQSTLVTRDATLDAFATDDDADSRGGGPGDDEKAVDADEGGDDETSDDVSAAGDEVDAPLPTTDWTPAGATCAACGAVVERRWRQDDALVCPDCKDWDVR
jgi:hypothetical protein